MRHFRLFLSAIALLLTTAIHAAVGDTFTINLLTYTVLTEDESNSTGTVSVKGDPTDINGDLTIPQTVTNGSLTYSVTEIADLGFNGCTGLTSVILPEGITTIGEHAFFNCSTLLSVAIPTTLTTSKSYAFGNCSNMNAVYIQDVVAYSQIDFYGQSNPLQYAKNLYLNGELLTELVFPEGVTEIKQLTFYHCTSVTSISFPSTLTKIGQSAFYQNTGLKELILPDNVTEIGQRAFSYSSNLESVKFSANMKEIPSQMLSGCSKLKTIVIPEGVTTIGTGAFQYVTSLTSIHLPSTLKNVGSDVFAKPKGTCSVYMDNILDWYNIDFGNSGCPIKSTNTKLYIQNEEVDLVNLVVPEGVTTLHNNLFQSCSMIKSVLLPSTIQAINSNAFNYCSFDNLYIYNLDSWLKCDLQKGFLDKAANVFFNNETLTTLIIPDDVTEVKKYTFSGLKSLTDIQLNNVKTIGNASFYNCTGLTEIHLPASITSVGTGAFQGCSSLTSVQFDNPNTIFESNTFSSVGTTTNPCLLTAPADYTFSVSITGNYFKWMSGYFYIPATYGPYVIDELSYAVLTCNNSTKTGTVSVVANSTNITGNKNVPETFTEDGITWTVVKIGDAAFTNCTKLAGITIPATCTSWPKNAFDGCTSLTTATLDCELATIPNYTFYNCSKLETVNLKDNGSTVTTIGTYAFANCAKLTFNLPPNLKTINTRAFYKCSSIKSITFPASLTKIDNLAFSGCDIQQLEIPQKVTLGESAFSANKNMKKVTFLGSRTNPGGAGVFKECHLTEVEGIDNFTSIPANYFAFCDFTSFNIPASCKTISNSAFQDNRKLESISIPNGVTTIGAGVFYNCKALKSAVIPNSVTAFGMDENYVTTGEWQQGHASLGVFAFCTSLENATLSDNITYIPEFTFSNCYALKEFVVPEKTKYIRRYAFYSCYALSSINLGNAENILDHAFAFNSNLEQVFIPETMKWIGEAAFIGCSKIRMVKIPNSVTFLGGAVFENCSLLTHVTQPSYQTTVGDGKSSFYILNKCPLVKEYTLNAYADYLDPLISTNNARYTENIFVMGNTIPIPSIYNVDNLTATTSTGKPINIYVKKSVFDQQYSDGKVGSLKVDYKIPLSMTNAAGAPIEYKTLCRDFDVDLTHTNDNLPEGVEPLRAYVVEDVDGELRMVFLDEIKYIPSRLKANVKDENGNLYQGVDEYVGVLLRGTPGYTYYYEMGEHDYTQGAEGQWLLDDAMEYSGKTFEKNLMSGDANDDFYVFKTVEDDNSNEIVNYGLNNGRFKIYHKDGWLTYNKSYLQLPKDVSAAIEGDTDAEGNANLTFVFDNADGSTNKVSSVEVLKNAESDIFYNTMGLRVKPNAKGVVINNGKKYVNK